MENKIQSGFGGIGDQILKDIESSTIKIKQRQLLDILLSGFQQKPKPNAATVELFMNYLTPTLGGF